MRRVVLWLMAYRFDASNPSTTKLPAYFDGKNFADEFGRGWIRTLSTNAEGALTGIAPFMDSFEFKQLISTEFGSDGSFYVLPGFFTGDANSALYRIDYVQGTRTPIAEVKTNKTSGPAPLAVEFDATGSRDPDGTDVTLASTATGRPAARRSSRATRTPRRAAERPRSRSPTAPARSAAPR